MYLRHRQIVEFHRHARLSNVWFLRTSTGFLWLGYLAAFGLSMVANFQVQRPINEVSVLVELVTFLRFLRNQTGCLLIFSVPYLLSD